MRSSRVAIPTALGLADQCIDLADNGTMRPYAKTAELFRNDNQALTDGRVLALHRVSHARDVHYPTWEMHPEGDELLMLASGSLAVEFRDSAGAPAAELRPLSAIIVPAGTWHRLIVHEPLVLIAITPRRNTVHEHP